MLYLKPNHQIRYKGFAMNFYILLGVCWVIFCLLEEEKQDEVEKNNNVEVKQHNVIVIKASLCLAAWHSDADVAPLGNTSLKPLTLVISPIFFISNTNSLQLFYGQALQDLPFHRELSDECWDILGAFWLIGTNSKWSWKSPNGKHRWEKHYEPIRAANILIYRQLTLRENTEGSRDEEGEGCAVCAFFM